MSNFIGFKLPNKKTDLFININNIKSISLENSIYKEDEKCYTIIFNDKTIKYICNPENMKRIEKFLNITTEYSNKKNYNEDGI